MHLSVHPPSTGAEQTAEYGTQALRLRSGQQTWGVSSTRMVAESMRLTDVTQRQPCLPLPLSSFSPTGGL